MGSDVRDPPLDTQIVLTRFDLAGRDHRHHCFRHGGNSSRPSPKRSKNFEILICINLSSALLSVVMPRESAVEAVTRATSCKRAAGNRRSPVPSATGM